MYSNENHFIIYKKNGDEENDNYGENLWDGNYVIIQHYVLLGFNSSSMST